MDRAGNKGRKVKLEIEIELGKNLALTEINLKATLLIANVVTTVTSKLGAVKPRSDDIWGKRLGRI